MNSTIVIRRDGNVWVVELKLHNGQTVVTLGRNSNLKVAMQQALNEMAELASQVFSFSLFYCHDEMWKDLEKNRLVIDFQLSTALKLSADDLLAMCNEEPES
jgi:predicted nuclease of restriction endonuclease-like RecB superfamily